MKTMYGCFDAHLVYGFEDPDWHQSLDATWVESRGLRTWASAVIRNNLCSSIYGVEAMISEDGVASVDPGEKLAVDEFFLWYSAYRVGRQKRGGEEASIGKPCFRVALSGDYESEHVYYTLDDAEEAS